MVAGEWPRRTNDDASGWVFYLWEEGRAERTTTLVIRADHQPAVSATPPAALTSAWDAAAQTLTLTIRHDAGAVELSVRPA